MQSGPTPDLPSRTETNMDRILRAWRLQQDGTSVTDPILRLPAADGEGE